MAGAPPGPASRWPFDPYWELEGFDFRRLVLPEYGDSMRRALHRHDFTTHTSAEEMHSPSQAVYSRRVCNNVAVLFRAMLYCKDVYPQAVFWPRVQSCCRLPDAQVAVSIGNIFLDARKAYLRTGQARPNGAAIFVDQWIAFLDSARRRAGFRLQTPARVPWHTRLQEWAGMRARGDLTDAGQSPVQRAGTGAPLDSTRRPEYPVVKLESEESDDASVVDLGSFRPAGFVERGDARSKRKRADGASPRSAKRRARASTRADAASEPRRRQLQSPPLSSPSAQRSRRHDSALAASASSPAARDTAIHTPPLEHGNDGQLLTAAARITNCEERLAEQMNMILDQDLRLGVQGDRIARHTTQIESLDSRLKTVEENTSPGRQRLARGAEARQNRHDGDEIEALRLSVVELTDRLNNRNSYIRSEVRKQWNEVHSPVRQEQNRSTTRLDAFSNDLAIHKTRLEDCQKAVEEHDTKIKNQGAGLQRLENSLKKFRIRHGKIDSLRARIDEIEEKINGESAAADSGADRRRKTKQSRDARVTSQLESRVEELLGRVEELEKRAKAQDDHNAEQKRHQVTQSTIDRIFHRLKALEDKHSGPRGGPKSGRNHHQPKETNRSGGWGCPRPGRNPSETRPRDQAEQLARQERMLDSLSKQLTGIRTQVRNLNQPRAGDKEKKGKKGWS